MDEKPCVCGKPINIEWVFDTGSSGAPDGHSYACRIAVCMNCGTLWRELFWHDPGVMWILVDGTVKHGGQDG